MIIILIGYMASGKSLIGTNLAQKLNYKFIDLDQYIENQEAQTISNLFKTKGEIYFRKTETLALQTIINTNSNLVLALGGGTPCYSGNMNTIVNTHHVVSVYLKASVRTLVNRLQNETNKRPLIAHITTKEALTEFVAKHLFERAQYYNLSNTKINTDQKTCSVITTEIIAALF